MMSLDKELEIKEIEKQFPSLCWGCEYARKPASDKNTRLGYVGCCMRARTHGMNSLESLKLDYDEIDLAAEIAEGWVDLKTRPTLGKGSGIISNFQLLTIGVKKCTQYVKL